MRHSILFVLSLCAFFLLGACAERPQKADMSGYMPDNRGDSSTFKQAGNMGSPDRRCEMVNGREKCYGKDPH